MNVQGGMGQMQINIGPGGMPQGIGVGMQTIGGPPGMQGPMPGGMPGMQMQGGGMPGMPVGGMPGPPVMQGPVVMQNQAGVMHASPQNPNTPGQIMQAAQQQQQSQPQEKLDNISKVKSLIGPLKESLNATLKTAAQSLHQNNLIDAGTIKGVDTVIPRFDKHIEEFFSYCDQIELHLKTAAECMSHAASSSKYLPFPVALTRTEPIGPDNGTLTYPQYLSTVRGQVLYAKEIQDSLTTTAHNIAPPE